MNKEEKEIQEIYRSYLRAQVASPEVRREKREFIAAHFPSEKPFILRPAFLLPAMSLSAVVLFLFVFLLTPHPAKPPVPLQEPIPEIRLDQPVEVMRLTSNVGSTMVYQKMIQDSPITIIWVFHGGNGK
jgi:hypothetical protein